MGTSDTGNWQDFWTWRDDVREVKARYWIALAVTVGCALIWTVL